MWQHTTYAAPLTVANTFVFGNVTPGSYLADVHCATHAFAPLRIDVVAVPEAAAAEPQPPLVQAWETFRGNDWNNKGEAVREAHEAIKQLQQQLESQKRSSEVTIQAYMKERDTLRSLLQRQQESGAIGRVPNGINGQVQVADSDLARELEEVQKQFEAYRTEMGFDSTRLREETVNAQREVSRLGTALAKANAQIEVLTGQYPEHSQSRFEDLR